MLVEAMTYLSRFRADGREMGRIAAEHVKEIHAPDRVAVLLIEALALWRTL